MQIVQRAQEKLLEAHSTMIGALEKYEAGKVILTPWDHQNREKIEQDMDTLFDNWKFRKLQEIAKIND
eukprot:8615418-Karenia_brevis.AAC.1